VGDNPIIKWALIVIGALAALVGLGWLIGRKVGKKAEGSEEVKKDLETLRKDITSVKEVLMRLPRNFFRKEEEVEAKTTEVKKETSKKG